MTISPEVRREWRMIQLGLVTAAVILWAVVL
jgi:hypothetical protein